VQAKPVAIAQGNTQKAILKYTPRQHQQHVALAPLSEQILYIHQQKKSILATLEFLNCLRFDLAAAQSPTSAAGR
jgi:flagellar biosynthesis/type III secretory pathway chaperone